MKPWKERVVVLTMAVLIGSFPIFLVSGYTALYWAWLRANLGAALPYLPWARNFGMLAMVGASAAFVILFTSKTFPLSPKTRLWLSLLSAITISFFAEFRNEGKFYLKTHVHFFGPGTWIHDGTNQVLSSFGNVLYRFEYSHLNDFLMGPAIVSVFFSLVFVKIYAAFRNQRTLTLGDWTSELPTDLEHALRFARILMYVGLFWFFIQAWAEKAGYLSNPHSSDEIDLPFEFAGTMLGFWMARVLTKPFDGRSEKFRSTFLVDFLSSGVIGLLYTLVVGPLTESVASSVAHALFPVVPNSLDVHEYTPFQRHTRPFELLLLAGAMWWGLNRTSNHVAILNLSDDTDEPISNSSEEIPQIVTIREEPTYSPNWYVQLTIAKAFGITTGYLLVLAAMLSFLEPQGLGWTLITAGTGMALGTLGLWIVRRVGPIGLMSIFSSKDETPAD